MIHVTVADAEDIAGQRKVRASADVEADIQLGDLNDGFLTSDAVTDNVDGPEAELGEFLDEECFFWCGRFGHRIAKVNRDSLSCRGYHRYMDRTQYALVRKPSPKYGAFYVPKGIQVDQQLTQRQHEAYVAALTRAGAAVTAIPPHLEHHDCVFIEDTAIVWHGRALITRMNDVREGEQRDIEAWLTGKFEITHLPAGARLEGGDVLHLEDVTLVGRSARTNDAGIEALRTFMEPLGHPVQAIPVTRCLHLKSAITYLGNQTVLISPQLLDFTVPSGYSAIEVASSEPHAGNALRVNDLLLCAASFSKTNATLLSFCQEHNIEQVMLDISETQKGDGALTCQSILW